MSDAGELMAKWGHGGLPVVDAGEIVGLVTRKDVDKASRHRLEHAPVRGFMGRDVVTVRPEADLGELERLLASRGFGRLPVVSAGELIGIVTRKDVLRAEHGDGYLNSDLDDHHPRAREAFVRNVDTLLPPEVRTCLESVGQLGQEMGVTTHVVGGFVRDMVMGRPNLDIDVVIEGDGVEFALAAAERLGARVKVHRRFGTAVLVVNRQFHIDVASSRSEYYTRPGALPTVERSSLRQDLFRRDFTINAMSACLDPDCWGSISDPFGGLLDIRRKRLRILHPLSFIDDPTRVLRAARFEIRYGFRMDEHTVQLASKALELGVLGEVSGARIRDELYDIFDEAAPLAIFGRLDEVGALATLLPQGTAPSAVMTRLIGCSDALASFAPRLSAPCDSRAVFVAGIAGAGEQTAGTRWIRHLRIGKDVAEAAVVTIARGSAVTKSLRDRRGMRDSRLFRLLQPLPVEALVCLWGIGDALARERIERFAFDLNQTAMSVSGHDLVALGAVPGEEFSAILAQARDDLLDGRVCGRESELANLRRLAVRAGLLPTRKGTA
jgi:tRNA nucleotidyltransferase (CCA-adding enzyme)